jgi:hypothetical protein
MHKIEKIYDNTKDGIPNYSIQLVDGKMLYARGVPLYPVPSRGDSIEFTIINTKTSEKGNQYSNIKDVQIVTDNGTKAPQQLDNVVGKTNFVAPNSNGMNKNDTQRMDIFVTGIVGRAMGSGQFSVHDIAELTKNAVSAFNENLKKL